MQRQTDTHLHVNGLNPLRGGDLLDDVDCLGNLVHNVCPCRRTRGLGHIPLKMYHFPNHDLSCNERDANIRAGITEADLDFAVDTTSLFASRKLELPPLLLFLLLGAFLRPLLRCGIEATEKWNESYIK